MTEPVPEQPNNPLHGIKLEKILTDLRHYYGWEWLGDRVPVRCFLFDPSINSSLKFLRRTPWARAKVENLYWGYLSETGPARNAPPAGEPEPAPEELKEEVFDEYSPEDETPEDSTHDVQKHDSHPGLT